MQRKGLGAVKRIYGESHPLVKKYGNAKAIAQVADIVHRLVPVSKAGANHISKHMVGSAIEGADGKIADAVAEALRATLGTRGGGATMHEIQGLTGSGLFSSLLKKVIPLAIEHGPAVIKAVMPLLEGGKKARKSLLNQGALPRGLCPLNPQGALPPYRNLQFHRPRTPGLGRPPGKATAKSLADFIRVPVPNFTKGALAGAPIRHQAILRHGPFGYGSGGFAPVAGDHMGGVASQLSRFHRLHL
jgi:hypothetical protein